MKTKEKGMSYAKWGYIFLAPFFITFSFSSSGRWLPPSTIPSLSISAAA